MTDEQKKVAEFYEKFGLPVGDVPSMPMADSWFTATEHIREELEELVEAVLSSNIEKIADALADLQYVVLGAALRFGIDLEPIFNTVHEANMRKVWPEGTPTSAKYNDWGKYVKPPDWTPADLTPLLRKQGARI